jgi:hypothetical protein
MSHPSLRTAAPRCLPLNLKDSLKEDTAFALGFCLRLLFLLLAFGFGLLRFWLWDEGRLLDVRGFGREKDF